MNAFLQRCLRFVHATQLRRALRRVCVIRFTSLLLFLEIGFHFTYASFVIFAVRIILSSYCVYFFSLFIHRAKYET